MRTAGKQHKNLAKLSNLNLEPYPMHWHRIKIQGLKNNKHVHHTSAFQTVVHKISHVCRISFSNPWKLKRQSNIFHLIILNFKHTKQKSDTNSP
jgi:hypothetical protein